MRYCVRCGKEFSPKNKTHAICSDQCRRALRGYEYRTNRAKALHRDEYTCTEEDCTEQNSLECHHKKPLSNAGDNSLGNLQTLCKEHHKARHQQLRVGARIENEARRGDEEYHRAA
jgi:5-methylcytosine-specific restriction endonuclease McrA